LSDRADSAQEKYQTVSHNRSFESILLSDLSSDGNSTAERAAADGNAVTNATLVFFNSCLLEGQLAQRAKQRHQADFDVRETVKQASIPSSHI